MSRFFVVIILGIIAGLGVFIIHISNAPSYLSDEPETCINCHVMFPQYASWMHSSHARNATCNDCHVPQDNVFNTYYFKAQDGMRHSYVFTFRLEPQVIRIKDAGKKVVQQNCKRCHEDLVSTVSIIESQTVHSDNSRQCWDCHRETPHGMISSLSATPFSIVPQLGSTVPQWIKNLTKK